MRSGLIARKLGMSRVFQEDGTNLPVTVLHVDNCQVVAQRRQRRMAIRPYSSALAKPR